MNRSSRWFIFVLALLSLAAVSGTVLAQEPLDTRAARAEVRFLEGMIDHHQMALDMAAHCLERATTDEVRAICEAVIAAQTPEIEQMQAWLAEWYGIAYAPMSMLPASEPAVVEAAPAPSTSASSGMCSMMGGEGCAMMENMDMSAVMGGMNMSGMMGGDMDMPMMGMQMQMMMMQMQMMQMMMQHMGMGGMDMSSMSGMSGMSSAGGSNGMSGMSGMDMGSPAQVTPTPDHSAHHPAAEATEEAVDHSQHNTATISAGSGLTDPAMTMGMFAGLERLTGLDYDLAWLEAMIEHHDGAIRMAERVQQWATHDELIALADAIITAQSAEISQMEALIAELSA